MSNYKEMYYKLFKASQEAIEILIAAQKECEELFISGAPEEKKVVPFPADGSQNRGQE